MYIYIYIERERDVYRERYAIRMMIVINAQAVKALQADSAMPGANGIMTTDRPSQQ